MAKQSLTQTTLRFGSLDVGFLASVKHVERKYLHLNEEAMLKTAAARFKKNDHLVMFDWIC